MTEVSSVNEIASNLPTLHNCTTTTSAIDIESSSSTSKVAVITTLVFALMVALSNGGLLLIFLIKKETRRHLSIVQASNMINCLVGAIVDLTLRLPLFILSEDYVVSVSMPLCQIMRLIPDSFMMAILICLPLITAERLLKLKANPTRARRNKHVIPAILLGAYTVALIISVLPLTNIFGDSQSKLNTRCGGSLKYGYVSFAFTYSGITALSIILTTAFSIATLIALKKTLKQQKSKTKCITMKRGVIASISLTALLGIATIPFAIALQVILTCGGNQLQNEKFCDKILPHIFRIAVIIQKISFTLLPVIFLRLNPTMRSRIWLALRKPKEAKNIQTLSSTNTMTNTVSSAATEMIDYGVEERRDAEGNFILTLTEEKHFPDEVIRRMHQHSKHRQNYLDMVDILSVISEASESNSCGVRRSASYHDVTDDLYYLPADFTPTAATLPRSASIKRTYSNASYISDEDFT